MLNQITAIENMQNQNIEKAETQSFIRESIIT